MKLQTFDQWGDQNRVVTDDSDSCHTWYGIAIGPDSDDGIVLVDGHTLQGGRVLPLRQSRYSLQRTVPFDVGAGAEITGAGARLRNIRQLQVALLEDPSELAVEYARPNGHYSGYASQASDVSEPSPPGIPVITPIPPLVKRFHVPFTGRRQMHAVISAYTANPWDYTVKGWSWSPSIKGLVAIELASASALVDQFVSFYIGGTNEAERWDIITIDVAGDSAELFYFDVETIGEIGAR